jgi:hypothetical protein
MTEFGAWLDGMRAALRGERDADVPCDGCTACCTSSQFVHVEPDESDTLAHIPKELLFPAPGKPRGHVVLGYDERGHCPMLVDGRCSIYAHRPRACRTYDCRVFTAAGVRAPGDVDTRAGQWTFTFETDGDRARYEAVRAAAARLESESTNPTAVAVRAVETYDEPSR